MKSSGCCLCRREFLKGSLAVLAFPGAFLSSVASSAGKGMLAEQSLLAVVEGEDYRAVAVEAVRLLGGMSSFVPRGSTVVVKPNIGWDRTVEQGANTHPHVVRAVVEMCLEAGAELVLVFDRTCNDARRCYVSSGMDRMVKELSDRRVKLEFVAENRFRVVEFPKGRLLKKWPIYAKALDADVLINVPVAKHHGISGLTMGMKNLMGIMGGNRGAIHGGIGQKLADLASAVTPALNILDATRIMLRNGPSGGRLQDLRALNRVIACTDLVALDAFGSTLFGMDPGRIPSVVAGSRLGLGEMDLARVRILEGGI